VFASSYRACNEGVRRLGIEGLGESLGVRGGGGIGAIAEAYADDFEEFRDAAYEGCLEALRDFQSAG
jgi:hypothetical protein